MSGLISTEPVLDPEDIGRLYATELRRDPDSILPGEKRRAEHPLPQLEEEAAPTDADLLLQEQREFPPLVRVFSSELIAMIRRNELLATLGGIMITDELIEQARMVQDALVTSEGISPYVTATFTPLVEFILSRSVSEEYQYMEEMDLNTVTLMGRLLEFADHRPDFVPEQRLKDAHREFGEFGGVNASVCTSTTFTTMRPEVMERIFKGEIGTDEGCFLYGRHFNPNALYFGLRLAAMEDTEIAYPTASGMSAIMCTLMQIVEPGDEIVTSGAVYGGTHARLEKFFPKWGVETNFVRPSDTKGFEEAITPKTKVVYVETEANPTMEIADLRRIADLAHANGAKLVVDNTFTPLTFTPSHFGADVVVYSTTKFLNGRSDAIGGAICCSQQFLLELMDLHEGELMLMGPVMEPANAHQLDLYLNDLPLRIRAHSQRALEIARRLDSSGLRVGYPGLEEHPQHELAKNMMNADYGYGGMISIDFETPEIAERFVERLQELGGGLNAVSLGYFDTLASISGSSTSSEIDGEKQRAMGLTPGLTRISIGYTGTLQAQWEAIEKALWYARLSLPHIPPGNIDGQEATDECD